MKNFFPFVCLVWRGFAMPSKTDWNISGECFRIGHRRGWESVKSRRVLRHAKQYVYSKISQEGTSRSLDKTHVSQNKSLPLRAQLKCRSVLEERGNKKSHLNRFLSLVPGPQTQTLPQIKVPPAAVSERNSLHCFCSPQSPDPYQILSWDDTCFKDESKELFQHVFWLFFKIVDRSLNTHQWEDLEEKFPFAYSDLSKADMNVMYQL